jgi:hypothetical protein
VRSTTSWCFYKNISVMLCVSYVKQCVFYVLNYAIILHVYIL